MDDRRLVQFYAKGGAVKNVADPKRARDAKSVSNLRGFDMTYQASGPGKENRPAEDKLKKGGKVKRLRPHDQGPDVMPMKKGGKVKKKPDLDDDGMKKGGRKMAKGGGNIMEGRYSTGVVAPQSRRASVPTVGALGRLK